MSNFVVSSLKYRPNEIWKMQANNKFLSSRGWSPNINFEDGLKSTISWYKKFNKSYLSIW